MAFIYLVVIVSQELVKLWTLGRRSVGRTDGDGRISSQNIIPCAIYTKSDNVSQFFNCAAFSFSLLFLSLSSCFENKLSVLISFFPLPFFVPLVA